jgi:exodeoxyribonuclease VII large subunit
MTNSFNTSTQDPLGITPVNIEYSVSEIADQLKRTIEGKFSYIKVKGEVSGLKTAPSGHVYFSLKDDKAVLNCICWAGIASKIPFKLEDGMELSCSGNISTYPARSNYQMMVNKVEVTGSGALLALLEERKKKLYAEGLFAAFHKKRIPFLPRKIGIITSPTGAVIRDILHRISDRFPTEVLLWGVLVQGTGAAEQVAEAIAGFNKLAKEEQPDLLIVARGGGSIEDLWPFNEEIVLRAVFASSIPLISAVGHETDTTLIDLVSDMRAPTPTAAAEMAVPVRAELRQRLDQFDMRLSRSLQNMLTIREKRFDRSCFALERFRNRIEQEISRLEQLQLRLGHGLKATIMHAQQRFSITSARLSSRLITREISDKEAKLKTTYQRLERVLATEIQMKERSLQNTQRLMLSYDYRNILKRGFAVVRADGDKVITSAARMQSGHTYAIEMHDGTTQVIAGGSSCGSRSKKKKAPTKASGQMNLL